MHFLTFWQFFLQKIDWIKFFSKLITQWGKIPQNLILIQCSCYGATKNTCLPFWRPKNCLFLVKKSFSPIPALGWPSIQAPAFYSEPWISLVPLSLRNEWHWILYHSPSPHIFLTSVSPASEVSYMGRVIYGVPPKIQRSLTKNILAKGRGVM